MSLFVLLQFFSSPWERGVSERKGMCLAAGWCQSTARFKIELWQNLYITTVFGPDLNMISVIIVSASHSSAFR